MNQINPDLPVVGGDVDTWGTILNAALDQMIDQGNTSDEAISTLGLARYTAMSELDAVRTQEVGVLDVPDMQAAFPGLPNTPEFPAAPVRLIAMSSWMSYTGAPTNKVVVQSIVGILSDFSAITLTRYIYFDPAAPATPILMGTWDTRSFVPGGGSNTQVLSAFANGAPRWQPWASIETASTFMRRDSAGRARVATPINALDIATKGYVDSANWVTPPVTAASSGTAGQRAYDTNFLYVCVANNTWKRTPLSTW